MLKRRRSAREACPAGLVSPHPAPATQDPLAPSPGAWAAALTAVALVALATLLVPWRHGPVDSRFVLAFPRSRAPAALCEFSSEGPRCHSVTTAQEGGQ